MNEMTEPTYVIGEMASRYGDSAFAYGLAERGSAEEARHRRAMARRYAALLRIASDLTGDHQCSECGQPSTVQNRWTRVYLCDREDCLEAAFDRFAAKTGVRSAA